MPRGRYRRWVARVELERVMGFDLLSIAVLSTVLITIERKAAHSGCCFLRMLFRKRRLVGIIAFDCGAQSKTATRVEDLGVVVGVIVPPGFKRHEDQHDVFTHFR